MSKFLRWSSRYKIGHPVLDLQHKELFGIINNLYEATDNIGMQKKCFADLKDYSIKHFTTEEEIMRLHKYPEDKIIRHKKAHAHFASRVENFNKAAQKGEKTLEIAMIYLKGWITQHVLDCDRDLIEYLKVPLKI